MSIDPDRTETTALAPDDAFAALGDETRLGILQTLGEADERLSFSELRERVAYDTSGNFSYHLDRLAGHFIDKTDEGYGLRQAGRRVVQAVLSGAVTEAPVVDRTRIDWPCGICGAPIEVSYRRERVERYCTECPGNYGEPTRPAQLPEDGYLGSLSLPPAGVHGRTPRELQQAASTWGHLEILAAVSGICPSCSARVEHSVSVCEDHDATDGLCDECGNRHALWFHLQCTNCIYDLRSAIGGLLAATTEVLAFLTAHGLNPFSPTPRYHRNVWDFDEEVLGTDPIEARYTFTVGDDSISVTVDEELNVVDVRR